MSLINIIRILLKTTLTRTQKNIKQNLTYSTTSQLNYIILTLNIKSYQSTLFHLITHTYSKTLLFLKSKSIIHSIKTIIKYSPNKNQNIILINNLTKHIPITKTTFLIKTLSLYNIPPLTYF